MDPRKHVWISNSVFKKVTEITAVCMNCGESKVKGWKPSRVCRGKKTEER